MTSPLQILRVATRRCRKTPGPALAIMLTLALGIGANTAIFSLVDALWLRPLSIGDPGHLIEVQSLRDKITSGADRESGSSYAEYLDIKRNIHAFREVASSSMRGFALRSGADIQLLTADVVSDNYFTTMGASPLLGVLPKETDSYLAHSPVLVLSYNTWQKYFGADPHVIGRIVSGTYSQAQVVAVLPKDFRGVNRQFDPQVYIPQSTWFLWFQDEKAKSRTTRDFNIYARLQPEAGMEQANSQLQALGHSLAKTYPEANRGRQFHADWQQNSSIGFFKPLSILLLAIAGAVLLVACTNIANLTLALSDSRRRELAMRSALGAKRRTLLSQLVVEYVLISVPGILGAILLAQQIIRLAPTLMANLSEEAGFDFRMDLRVLLFTFCISLLSVLFCGVIPGLRTIRVSPLDAMRTSISTEGRVKTPARKLFLTAQIGISVTLLIATGLLIRTLIHLETMDLGFSRNQNAAVLQLIAPTNTAKRQAFLESLSSRLKALPGTRDISFARVIPFPEVGGGAKKVVIGPNEAISATSGAAVWFNLVDEAYFRVMQVPFLRGRNFSRLDTPQTAPVAILNQTLAKQIFGKEDVVGLHIRIGRTAPINAEIVGVVKDSKYGSMEEPPQPYLYLPFAQEPWSDITLVVTTSGNAKSLLNDVRKAIRESNPNTPIIAGETFEDHMHEETATNRIAVWLTTTMGFLALSLSMIGLYSLISYNVAKQTHDIGIKMALGALQKTIGVAIFRQGFGIIAAGVTCGLCLAFLLGSGMSKLLYGVKILDPITIVFVISLVSFTSILSLIAPTKRAVRIQPAEALREE